MDNLTTVVFEDQNGEWVQIGEPIDFCGQISLSDDGNILVMTDFFNTDSSSINIFENQNGEWVETNSNFDDITGNLKLSNDGNIVAFFGVSNDNDEYIIRIFEKQNGNWVPLGDDIIFDNSTFPHFTQTISLSGDGQTLAVQSIDGLTGFISIYRYQTGSWNQLGNTLSGPNGFGSAISLSGNGNTIALGIPFSRDLENEGAAGGGSIFKFENGSWNDKGIDFPTFTVGGNLGSAISLSNDGTVVTIMAPTADPASGKSGYVSTFNINMIEDDILEDLPLENYLGKNDCTLFPNPTRENLRFSSQDLVIEKILVYNTRGNLILEEYTDESIVNMNVSVLSSGHYFLIAVTNTGREINKRFIKE